MRARRAVAFLCILVALAAGAGLRAQQQADSVAPAAAPAAWWLLDASADQVAGISGERAYRDLLAGRRPLRSVVVAIIDSGIDTAHVDLHAALWSDAGEVPGNGRDDDGDGYVDDTRGWDFIGGPDGKDVGPDTYEIARHFAELRARFGGDDPDTASAQARADYATYRALGAKLESKRAEAQVMAAQLDQAASGMERVLRELRSALGGDSLTVENVRALETPSDNLRLARAAYLRFAEAGLTPAELERAREDAHHDLEYHLNPDFDPRAIVGDDYADVGQRVYGNNDVVGPDPMHGTHVAGIVLGVPGNRELLADGMPAVRIMVVRAVPDGDERDKDIANGIRFAVDHGADIISMSFGKEESPRKDAVDDAVRYADEHGVLLVHAAGNEAADLDSVANFPNRYYAAGGQAQDWLEVGASSSELGPGLPAPFSNYGRSRVDLFAPGVDILSTLPGGRHGTLSGTSMAAPVVAGVAALLMAYFPDLGAAQVRQILLQTATRYADRSVLRPGSDDDPVRFGALSVTGGVVNAYAAVQAALQGGAPRGNGASGAAAADGAPASSAR